MIYFIIEFFWLAALRAAHPKNGRPIVVGLRLFVCMRFQDLFHSPPGVLFTFPSRYWFTIGGGVYLTLGGGPPGFLQGSSCPAVLGCQHRPKEHVVRDSHPLRCAVPGSFQNTLSIPLGASSMIAVPIPSHSLNRPGTNPEGSPPDQQSLHVRDWAYRKGQLIPQPR